MFAAEAVLLNGASINQTRPNAVKVDPTKPEDATRRFIRDSEIMERLSISRATLNRIRKRVPEFPPARKLTPYSAFHLTDEAEFEAYIEEHMRPVREGGEE